MSPARPPARVANRKQDSLHLARSLIHSYKKNYTLTGAGQQPQDGILSLLKRSFSYRGAMAWNQLSNQTRGMEDLTNFKLVIS